MEPADVSALVRRASAGDSTAWDAIVSEYGGLVLSVARSFRLSGAQTADAVQTTWLRLVEHLAEIREPERMAGWLRTTTRRVCLRMVRDAGREQLTDSCDQLSGTFGDQSGAVEDAGPEARLLLQDQEVLVRRAVATLPARHQELLGLLVASPPVSYELISAGLGMPVGSIGPTRARALARLRRALETAGLHDLALT
jgi:RNA polymerase sigma factor (sigma-70 family)